MYELNIETAFSTSVLALQALRAGLATAFYGGVDVNANEIFVSDGAKCDIARLQVWAQFCLNKVPLSVDI